MMKIRVLTLIPDLGMGGAERMVVHLLSNLDRDRFDAVLVTLFSGGHDWLLQELEGSGIPVWQLDKRLGFDASMFAAIDRVIRGYRPDIVHTHRYVLRYALPSIILRRVPAVVHTVHSVAGREVDALGRMIHRIAFKYGVMPVAIAEEVARSIRRIYKKDRCTVIPNGIPVQSYRSGAEERIAWRRCEGFRNSDILFVCVARLSEEKNHQLMLRAFARHAAGESASRLILVGDGPLRAALTEQVRQLRLEERVRFLGWRADVAQILGASDVFVLTSDYEGNPLSVMEAMAAGLPVVSTAVGGVPELVADGVTGILVTPGDVGALEDAMSRLAGDGSIRAEMGRAGRRVAEDRFDVRKMAAAYERLYERRLLGVRV